MKKKKKKKMKEKQSDKKICAYELSSFTNFTHHKITRNQLEENKVTQILLSSLLSKYVTSTCPC